VLNYNQKLASGGVKMKRWHIFIIIVLVSTLALVSIAQAQYPNPWWTTYQVVNMGNGPANIVIDYYDANGNVQTAARKTFSNVPVGGSVLVVQYTDDPALSPGRLAPISQLQLSLTRKQRLQVHQGILLVHHFPHIVGKVLAGPGLSFQQ
jgi:hypothetical protein